ncbi:MAG: (2Fe-2S)-binding protein [Alphaproteobacteria bacterium]|nr:(2Fe-2S)-binding protein [Alphaproteobacteria bacterium]MBU1549576.1 (2Fe-2S)-binding protein [Alphaproteobacteria bacterium]MBU2336431.1 (2Fe-2S)-binding protein [Alphaproteobacteria bacterium]MBU2387688.1 (2Fe-2S)-binding protein [Alphaproteobacteria bacterium]
MPRMNAAQRHGIEFTLNGQKVRTEAENRMLLSDLLRHEIGLTGTHVGCEHGVCGACTVQIDGKPARACLTLAQQVRGSDVRTVEALAPGPAELSPLQAAFRRHHGLQCGFCTPGILMSLDALLRQQPDAGRQDIREHLSGHLCRCTGYASIVEAALAAVEEQRKEETPNA